MESYFSNATLLKIPGKRAAYSDRTAYMMAEMSRLAYFRFEGGQNITEILASIKNLTSDSSKLAGIEAILKTSLVPGSEETGKKLLIPRHVDHRFHGMSITDSTACRSLIARHVDHPGASE